MSTDDGGSTTDEDVSSAASEATGDTSYEVSAPGERSPDLVDYIETPMASPLAAALFFPTLSAFPVMFQQEPLAAASAGDLCLAHALAPSCVVGLGAPVPLSAPMPAQLAPATLGAEEASPGAEPPAPPPGGGSLRVRVKNTFIDVGRELAAARCTQSCTARLSPPRAQFHLGPSPATAGARAGAEAREAAPHSVPVGAQASAGSRAHGAVGADGQPGCQPCAWFHKPSGCEKGAGCEYCHACPAGELKRRKRQKVDRLRREEAALRGAPGHPAA